MLGKVFENLLEIHDRKSKGAFYTPREIVHYMCQQSLIQYINSKLDDHVSLSNIEFLVHFGDVYSEIQDKAIETESYETKIPEPISRIKNFAEQIDNALATVKICDPAVGSGAFPVGMMHEIIRVRQTLLNSGFIKADRKHTVYEYKRQIIKDSIYGVDIEESAVEIAKLRLWLSLVVDEDDITNIKPLPNLDFKIVCGDSLTSIDKNLLNNTLVSELETIKDKYFDSFGSEKAQYTKRMKVIVTQLCNERFDLKVFFSDVFKEKSGFDIVIGNPPYIDSETMVKNTKGLRKLYSENYTSAVGNWDIFVLFFERGLEILNAKGNIGFIVPNKLLSKNYASTIRDMLSKRGIIEIRDYSTVPVFVSAAVYPITIFVGSNSSLNTNISVMSDKTQKKFSTQIAKAEFNASPWDVYFSQDEDLNLINKIRHSATSLVGDTIHFESPATVSDAYKLKEILKNCKDDYGHRKFINSGTINRYETDWGKKKTTYIKESYEYPIVSDEDLLKHLGNRRYHQTISPKLIIANMTTQLEVFPDFYGKYCAGKSTVISMCNSNIEDIAFYSGLLNSKLMSFIYRAYNNSSKMSGGALSVTRDRLEEMPMVEFSNQEKKK